jgi:protein-disulfide isomerase
MENPPRGSFVTLPGAIIIAAAIIAIALIWVKRPAPAPEGERAAAAERRINLAPVTAADHIFGNPNAPVKIVEYSDPSCPYCKSFNPTMVEIMNEYGPKGKVAWVYRHFPLDKPDPDGNILHPNAGREAQAMECAAALGGNDKFWAFEKRLYEVTPSVTGATPQGLDPKELPEIAKAVGLDQIAFNDCLARGEYKDKVESQYISGINAEVSGTPTSYLVLDDSVNQSALSYVANALIQYKVPPNFLYASDDRKVIVMSGALPKPLISGLINTLVGE